MMFQDVLPQRAQKFCSDQLKGQSAYPKQLLTNLIPENPRLFRKEAYIFPAFH